MNSLGYAFLLSLQRIQIQIYRNAAFFLMLKIRNIVFPVVLWALVGFLIDAETFRLLRPNLDVLCCLSSGRYEEEPVEPAGLVRLLCDNRRDEQGVCIPSLNPINAHRPAPECPREFRLSGKAVAFAETHLFNSKKTPKMHQNECDNYLHLQAARSSEPVPACWQTK